MGLFSPLITERIRRASRRRDLIRGVLAELHFLQQVMALAAYTIRCRSMAVTDDFLDAIIPTLENYKGPDRDEQGIEAIKNSRKRPEDQRAAIHQAMRKPNAGLTLRQYSVPLITTLIPDLTICSSAFLQAVLHIRFHLDQCNQVVPPSQALLDKTFSVLSPENEDAVKGNLEQMYRQYGNRAELIVKAIKEIDDQFGPHRRKL